MSDALEVGKKLVALCNEGKNMEAIDQLYADDVVSIEAMSGPDMPARMEGKPAIVGKSEWWYANHEVHGGTTEGPWPHGDQFIARFQIDVTAKVGPMAGQRMQMDEMGLYTVKDGKIVEERFFYSMEMPEG